MKNLLYNDFLINTYIKRFMENFIMQYVDTLSKFGTKLEGYNQRVKFTHLPTRYRVRFFGMSCPSL